MEKAVKINPMDGVMKELEDGVKDLFESGNYKEYLDVMSRFYNYSFNNNLLIAMQRPDATHVASFTAWKEEFGRNVKKGEKGIHIIAPVIKKEIVEKQKFDPKTKKPLYDDKGNPVMEAKEKTKTVFRVVNVFDISQTAGKELPEIAKRLEGDVENVNEVLSALGEISPVPIRFGKVGGQSNGYYSGKNKEIVIRENLSDSHCIKTCIHEISHALLHDKDHLDKVHLPLPDARTREVQAESIAYVVCRHFNIDSSDYSFGYIASWSKDKELDELKASMNTIRYTASSIIRGMEKELYPQKDLTDEQEETKQNTPSGKEHKTYNNKFSAGKGFTRRK